MSSEIPDVAFLGLGLMGEPMAMRLSAGVRSLRVWNRTSQKTLALAARGAHVASTPAAAVKGMQFVFLMLSDGQAVAQILSDKDLVAALQPGSIVIDMSSIPPAQARDNASRLMDSAIEYLDAPVSGGTKGAAEGSLAIMVGGNASVFESAKGMLLHSGTPTLVGPSGSGQLAKLANQIIVAVTIGAVAEALVLAAAGGADPARVKESLRGGFADSKILSQHGQRMLDRGADCMVVGHNGACR